MPKCVQDAICEYRSQNDWFGHFIEDKCDTGDDYKESSSSLYQAYRNYTVNYDLSPREAALYHAVTEYVQEEFNRADQLSSDHRSTVGFALTILQRRLASSPEAIYQ